MQGDPQSGHHGVPDQAFVPDLHRQPQVQPVDLAAQPTRQQRQTQEVTHRMEQPDTGSDIQDGAALDAGSDPQDGAASDTGIDIQDGATRHRK